MVSYFLSQIGRAHRFMNAALDATYTERYRSGHNEAVLKTVWVQAHKGSNPFLSATFSTSGLPLFINQFGEVLKRPKRRPC